MSNRRPPTARELIAAWDALAHEAEFSHPPELNAWAARLDPGLRVLDLGCGYGRVTAALHDAGFEVVGVDSSPAMIARGLAERPDLTLHVVAPGPLPFADASFDAACLLAVLTCLPAPTDRAFVAVELERVLRPGGWLLVSDVLVQDCEHDLVRYADGARRFGHPGTFALPGGPVLKHFRVEELVELFSAFHLHEALPFDVATMRGNPSRAVRLWLRRP